MVVMFLASSTTKQKKFTERIGLSWLTINRERMLFHTGNFQTMYISLLLMQWSSVSLSLVKNNKIIKLRHIPTRI